MRCNLNVVTYIYYNIFLARKYASKEIEKQKTVFKSWGILADWDKNCYYTCDKNYIQTQIHQFFKLYNKVILNIITF